MQRPGGRKELNARQCNDGHGEKEKGKDVERQNQQELPVGGFW